MVLLTVFVSYENEHTATWLIYNRELILKGQLWRLLTGHLVHYNLTHLAIDSLMFIFLVIAVNKYYNRINNELEFHKLLFFSAVTISLALLFIRTNLNIYAGLSGINSVLFGVLSLQIINNETTKIKMIIVSLNLALILRIIFGINDASLDLIANTGTSEGLPFVTEHFVHLYGLVLGYIKSYFLTSESRNFPLT